MIEVNTYFDHVYVLNLAHRMDRKIAMIKKLNQLGIHATFVNAVNGALPGIRKAYQTFADQPIGAPGTHPYEVRLQKKMIDSPGAWGYLRTYQGILQDALQHNYERILCLDDDVLFDTNFPEKFTAFTQKVPADWKLCYLGASQYSWEIPYAFRYPDPEKLTYDPAEPFYFPNHTDGSFAVGIHRSVFGLLLYETSKMNCAFDSGPLHAVSKVYPDACFVANPNIVVADVSDSDIRASQQMGEVAKTLRWNLADFQQTLPNELVSVIMPAHNAAQSIDKAIQSILHQTYPHLELIIVDDASTDNTAAVVREWEKQDERVKLFQLTENQGVGKARNEAIRQSKGAFILFQDADDISLQNRIITQLLPFYEKDMLFSLSRYYRTRASVDELNPLDEPGMMALVESRRIKLPNGRYQYWDQAILAFATAMFRRRVFETYGLYRDLRFGEDMELLERVLYHTIHEKFKTGVGFGPYEYLSQCTHIPAVYHRVDAVLLVGVEHNEQNLTVQFQGKTAEILALKEKYRKEIEKGIEGIEKLPPLSLRPLKRTALFNTLYINTVASTASSQGLPPVGRDYALAEMNAILLEDMAAMRKSFSWRITSPIRKIAGLFLKKR